MCFVSTLKLFQISIPLVVNALARNFVKVPNILGFHCGILQSIWRGVNLECIDEYAVVESANDTKLHVFATKHKANTYSEQLIHSDDCVSI
jgi:hypothetical protein